MPNSENYSSLSPLNLSNGKEDSLERTILGMASLDLATAIQSMNAMESVSTILSLNFSAIFTLSYCLFYCYYIFLFHFKILKSHQVSMLQSKEDKFISSVNMQLKLLQTYPLHQGNALVSKGFRITFMIILTVIRSRLL